MTSFRLPQDRPHWRGTSVAMGMGKGTRLMVGCLFFLITCLSVLLGVGYPFWILPGLVILFCIGTGYGGFTQQAVLIGRNGLETKGEEIEENCVTFNHLLSFSCDVSDEKEEQPISTPSSHFPVVLFQVYSVGYWFGRQRLEGYGYVNLIPTINGRSDVSIGTWRPVSGIQSRMRSFFLSDSVRLKEPSFVEVLNKSIMSINRFGVMTESTGISNQMY